MNAEEQELRQRHNANQQAEYLVDSDATSVIGFDSKSPGIRRIEAIAKAWNKVDKTWFIVALCVLTYARLLGASTLGTFQAIALNEFKAAQQSGLVRTVRQVLTSASLPITAKLSDYIGRTFMLNMTVLFWLVGPIVVATSNGLGGYLPGFLLYTLGHVAGNILNYALSIDTSTLRNRLFLQFCFVFPSIINVWAGGVVADRVTEGPGWRWGAGMWAIIIPVLSIGLICVLLMGTLKARRKGLMEGIPTSWRLLFSLKSWVHLFWVMDVVGLIFLAAALGLILLPLALGGGSAAKWATANTIVPLVIGVLLLPVFALWEIKWAVHPIFPAWAMRDRHVMIILLMQFLKNIGSSTRDAYLYFTLVVSFNQGTEGATRINSLEGFASTVTVIFVAFIIRRWRVVKPLVVAGTVLVVVAQGMLIHFRGGYSRSQLAGLIAGEILDGIGTGLSSHPALVAMQAKLSHEHALLITSCWAVGSQAGGGIAAAISGAIWTNQMPKKLFQGLSDAGIPDARKLSQSILKSPLSFVKTNPPGSPAREAVVFAYRDVQRTLTIIGVCFAAVCIPLALLMDNVQLVDKKNLVDDDQSEDSVSFEDEKRNRRASEPEVDDTRVVDDKRLVEDKRLAV